MTRSSLKAEFTRLGPTKDIDIVPTGSSEVVVLSLGPDLRRSKVIEAVFALHKRGVPTLKAKRAVEAALERKKTVLDVPLVEDVAALASELKASGFAISLVTNKAVDVKRLRERLRLTQEQFALRFGLDIDAVRNWEYGRRDPDRAARSYLTVIDRDPDLVQDALAVPVI
jgi:DNA-binding transcriptional regulator YiaG